MPPSGNHENLRRRIAFEAARILADFGSNDYASARRKAAGRLGCRNRKHLPTNTEIEQALIEYQQLFHNGKQPIELRKLRVSALQAMEALQRFDPRLVGTVLRGSAHGDSRVQLHIFCDTPEQLVLQLMEMKIPWEEDERRLLYPDGSRKTHPAFNFQAGETGIELIWFPPEGLRTPPLSSIDNQPESRATIRQLRELLEQADTPPHQPPEPG
jgi:hypothetical protein